ncbi:autotransporter domain-containing protein [Roseibium sp. SCPC15]|uniref:autotransporter family protein n=1 Tax=Roseibium sp. SCP15 TaxID=3141376 RepID=UPI00333C7114
MFSTCSVLAIAGSIFPSTQAHATNTLILQGDYIKVGISDNGSLGVGGNTTPGIQFDGSGTGTFNDSEDYLTPGSPFYGFTVEYDAGAGSQTIQSNNASAFGSLTGTLTDYSGVKYNGATYDNRAVYEYTSTDLNLSQDVYFEENGKQLNFSVSLTANVDLTDVYYGVYTDPDVYAAAGDSSITDNFVKEIDGYQVAYAQALASKYVIGFATNDDDAKAGITSPWSTSAQDYYNGGNQGAEHKGDDAIGLGFNLNSVSSGTTKTVKYSVIFGTDIEDAVTSGLTPNIDTGQSSYSTQDLADSNVNPVFEGGKLAVSDDGVVMNDFTINDAGGTLDNSGNTVAFGGSFTSGETGTGSFTFSGSGTTTLANSTNSISGGVNLDQGTLNLGAGANLNVGTNKLQIQNGAKLSGSGSVTGDINVSGTIAPGSSPGTMTVAGSVTSTDTTILQEEIDGYGTGTGAGNYDRLVLTGSSSVYTADGTLEISLRGISGSANNNFTPIVGDAFEIVAAEGGITGGYDTVTQPTSGLSDGTRFDVVYSENAVTLYVTPDSYGSSAVTTNGNASAAGTALDSVRSESGASSGNSDQDALFTGLVGLGADSVDTALEQTSAGLHANLIAAARQAGNLVRQGSLARAKDAVFSQANSVAVDIATHGNLENTQTANRVWLESAGQISFVGDDGVSEGYRNNAAAIFGGYDLLLMSHFAAGAGAGYSSSDVSTSSIGSGHTDSFHAFTYAGYARDGAYVSALFGASYDTEDSDRSVSLSTGSATASGETEGYTIYADVEAGYRVDVYQAETSSAYVLPFAGLAMDTQHRNSYTETGDNSVTVSANDYDGFTGQSRLGLTIGTDFNLSSDTGGNSKISLSASAAWLHGFGDGWIPGVTNSLHNTSWTASAADPGSDAFEGRLDLSLAMNENVSAFVSGSYIGSENSDNGRVMGGLSITW